MVVNSDAVLVGQTGQSFVVDAQQSLDAALTAALQALPAQGGDLFVLPRSDSTPYLFRGTTLVDRPRVTLNFSRGATLGFAAGPRFAALVRVVAADFRCRGAHVVHAVLDTDAQRSCFLVEEGGAGSVEGASFEDCRFDMQQVGSDIRGFSCIRARGTPRAPLLRGLSVHGTTFHMRLGSPQSQAWSRGNPPEPYGVCAIRISDSCENLIGDNRFVGDQSPRPPRETGRSGPLLYLSDAPHSVVHGNTFRFVNALSATGDSVLVRLDASAGRPLASVWTGNVFEGVSATHVLEARPARDLVICASNFGRLVAGPRAGIRAAAAAGGESGEGLVLYGNNYHNIGGASGRMIDLQAARNVSISSGAFTLVSAPQTIALADGSCANVWVDSAQARAQP